MSREFIAAMRAQDWNRAQQLLADLASPIPDSLLRSIAELHMVQQRFSEAADALGRMKHRNVDAEMKRKLCANLAAMKTHRPAIYRILIEAEPGESYSVAPSRSGHPTILYHKPDGATISMSADNDPEGGVRTAMKTIDAPYRSGKALGLAGLGDGYLLAHLAKNHPELILGRRQAIVMIEPDAQLVLTSLMIHDFTGPDGPIEQQRVSWYVGSSWLMQFRDEFFGDLFKMYPGVTIRTGLHSAAIERELEQFLKDIADLDKRFVEETQPYYARVTRDQLVSMLGENPPRQPRVLVMTTRFSTVLQYSASDTADAFRKLGWDAQLLIEPTAWHGLNRIAMRQAVAKFKPDLIFQIDHLRGEYGELFPANLPAVCWVQDHLPNLMSASAGASVSLRDFVLLENPGQYHQKFGYPLRQCIYLNKATRVPPAPANVEQGGDTMVFVSNCSHDPNELATKLVDRIEQKPVKELARDLCRRMIERYSAGGCIQTIPDLDAALAEVERDHNIRAGIGDQRDKLIHALWHPFNDTLYRQQALRWVASAADSLGLTLGLYGNGWEKNAEFSRFARGYAQYGEALESLTRRTKINLHIVPFACIHQRLLDGLVCGGFFMVRDHPANHFAGEMTAFMREHLPQHVNSIEAARGAVSGARLGGLENLLTRYRRLSPSGDPIARIREAVHEGLTTKLPQLDAVTFDNAEQFTAKVQQFISRDESRRQIAGEQRAFVERYFTYESNMRRVIAEIRERLSSEPNQMQSAA